MIVDWAAGRHAHRQPAHPPARPGARACVRAVSGGYGQGSVDV